MEGNGNWVFYQQKRTGGDLDLILKREPCRESYCGSLKTNTGDNI